jgi:hypothetical protein
MDIKHMPDGVQGYKFLLVMLCESTNFLIAKPLRNEQAEGICSAIFDDLIAFFGSPTHIVCDKGPAFTSSLTKYFSSKFGMKQIFVSPTNHKSLLAEHGIKSLSNTLMKHLSEFGRNWPHYSRVAMLNYNGYDSPNLDGMSPGELLLGHKLRLIPEFELDIEPPVSGTFTEYKTLLNKKLAYLREKLQKFRDKRQELLNRDKELHAFTVGQIVYMYNPRGAHLQTGTRKISCQFVGPLVIYKVVAPNQFLLMSLDGKVYPHLVEETRLKEGKIWTTKGNVSTLAELRNTLLGQIQL